MVSNGQADHQSLLSTLPLFSGLSRAELSRLSRATKQRQLAAGEEVFHKGEPGTHLYAVLEGCVKVRATNAAGKRIAFERVGAGQFFGEIAVLDREPRSASVVALEPTRLLCLDRRDVFACLRRNPETAVGLALSLVTQVRRLTEALESQVFDPLAVRLARKLLQLTGGEESESLHREPIGVRLSQQEIGELIGTSRESVNKQLRAWSSEGLVAYVGGTLTLLQPDAFGRIAGLQST